MQKNNTFTTRNLVEMSSSLRKSWSSLKTRPTILLVSPGHSKINSVIESQTESRLVSANQLLND